MTDEKFYLLCLSGVLLALTIGIALHSILTTKKSVYYTEIIKDQFPMANFEVESQINSTIFIMSEPEQTPQLIIVDNGNLIYENEKEVIELNCKPNKVVDTGGVRFRFMCSDFGKITRKKKRNPTK